MKIEMPTEAEIDDVIFGSRVDFEVDEDKLKENLIKLLESKRIRDGETEAT